MSFDFLPNKPENPSQNGQGGSTFSKGKNHFFDFYRHHLDAHALFSTPPKHDEFNLKNNYDVADKIFSEDSIKFRIDFGDWFGENTEFDKLINGYTEFQNPQLLSDTINEIDANIDADLFSELEKPKININDRFGIFSFDLASMAMTYVYEYFKKSDGKKVDADRVVKQNNKFYFGKHEVEQRIKKRKNGTPVVRSSVRNCFLDFQKQDKKDRSVEIFVTNSFQSDERAKDLIYNSMAAISMAQNLILKGFKVKITSLLVSNDKNNYYWHFVPAKRFNQPLDPNAAAYICGDTRFFRYQGFKMIIAGADKVNKEIGSGLGRIVTDARLISKTIETDYVPNSRLKQADTRLYFGGARSLEQAKLEVQTALQILNEKYSNNN
jgi:hypothetical protein